ncbi:unnamed protein product [Mytilus coruscus]|uniref:DED domain-containing protein n=1 Tax=Mytilus coruscus TaxID=42192 RepID=A0A6J8DDG0_MYTCO|nr:unnamed protein product [Mytilus coruscus]
MESVDSYRILTKEIALGLSSDNIKIIKFLIRDVGKGVLEKIITGTDIVQLLEERDMLSPEKVATLRTLLQTAGRNDLDKKVQQYVESAISRNLSNHDYYGLHGMYVNSYYKETTEYHSLCDHMLRNNSVILKGPPGTWKSQHAFRYAHKFSETRKQNQKSLIWRVECNTDLNIYNSLSHLMNFLDIQCINSENHMDESIELMLSRAIQVLESEHYKNIEHLFILLGSVSPQNNLIEMFLRQLSVYENISIIVTTSKSLSNDFDKFVIGLQGMTENEAVRFLNVDDSSAEKAKELAKRLSYLPDGLIFAKTYIHTTKISINTYIERLENITSTDSASKKACELLICKAENKMSPNEKKVLHFMPYLNTDNIPIFILKSLLPHKLNREEKAILIDNFIRSLENYSLISIKGIDEHRLITAHRFTLMIVKVSSTRSERENHLNELLNFFMCYVDLYARLLEVIHRNVLLLEHAETFLSHFQDCLKSSLPETKVKLCYVYCAIGITYRLYGNTELSANTYLQKAKLTMFETFLSGHQHHLPSDKSENPYTTLDEYLNGSDALQEHCKSIFNILIEKGKNISQEFVDEFVRNKYRNSRSISLLCEYGQISIEDVHTNQLNNEVVSKLKSKNLIMEGEHISKTFLVELMIRILYNSSKNKWLMEISKDSFSTSKRGKLRKNLSRTFPVTPESLIENQMAHLLTKSLRQHLSKLPRHDARKASSENTVRSFCPVFSPVTHRSGILYMLRSFSDPNLLSFLLKEALQVLDSLDFDIGGTGFTEFGVVKRIGDSSLFHSVMIDRIKMECYEKLFKLEFPDSSMKDDTTTKESLEESFILKVESIEENKKLHKKDIPIILFYTGDENFVRTETTDTRSVVQDEVLQNTDTTVQRLANEDEALQNTDTTVQRLANEDEVLQNIDTTVQRLANEDEVLQNTDTTVQRLANEDENLERINTTGVLLAFADKDLEATDVTFNRLPMENKHLLKALAIAKQLEEKIDDMTSWKALSGIHLKIATAFKHTKTEENIIKAKQHYKKAYDREYESNNARLTRFHLKALVHYAECCIQFPIEKDLQEVKTLALEMKYRFRLIETGTLFPEVIGDIDNCLDKLSQKQHPHRSVNSKEKSTVDTKSTQTNTLTNENNWLLKELKRKRDRLKQNQSGLLEHYKNLECDIETINREIYSVEEEIANIEERLEIEPYLS